MEETKRQVLPIGLWVVATPIGNLADLTPRAKQALEEAEQILCEDTRRTFILLSAVNIHRNRRSLSRFDEHSSSDQTMAWIEWMKQGKSLALVTDAGTPALSDPGARLVAASKRVGIRITPIPGVSAISALLSICGFEDTAFSFRGFFPRKEEEKFKEWELIRTSSLSRVFIWFESPQRILNSIQFCKDMLPDGEMVVGKELTKRFERLFYGSAEKVYSEIHTEISSEGQIGEWCFAICLPPQMHKEEKLKEELDLNLDWVKAIRCLLETGVSVSEAAKKVSQHFGIPRKRAYSVSIEIFNKKLAV